MSLKEIAQISGTETGGVVAGITTASPQRAKSQPTSKPLGANDHPTTLSAHLLIVAALAGWLNREQQSFLDYLKEENQVLREQLGTKSLRLSDSQRRRLAANGWEIGRGLLGEYATIVTPDTLLRWHDKLISQKWPNAAGGGRHSVLKKIEKLVVQMARQSDLGLPTSPRRTQESRPRRRAQHRQAHPR